MTEPHDIISDAEIVRVHGSANFGGTSPREVVNDGLRKTAIGYHCGHTQFSILREHGLITKPRGMSYDVNLTKKGKRYARALGWPTLTGNGSADAVGMSEANEPKPISPTPSEGGVEPQREEATYYGKDCPVGMVQVEFVGCPPSERYSDYGWKPTKSAFIELYVDGQRYRIDAGDIGPNCFDGKPRRGIHINYPMGAALGDRSMNALNLSNPGEVEFCTASPTHQASDVSGLDLHALAKDASERVHKNGGCVPQLAYAPILFALQDAVSSPNPSGDADVREAYARAIYANRPAQYLHPEVRDLSWEEAQTECPGRIATIYSDADAILALTGNASTDRAGTERSEVSPNLQTPAPQGGGEALSGVIDEMTSLANLMERGEAGMVVDRIRALRDRLAALKPQTPDVLGEGLRQRLTEMVEVNRRFVAARKAMNEKIPGMEASPAERALYHERCQADVEAGRAKYEAAITFIQDLEGLLATSPGDVLGGEGEGR